MTTSADVGKRRLLKLADFLEKLEPERFDYGSWVGEDWKGKPNLSCGTTACALGWATTIPSLRKAGLRMAKHPYAPGGYVALINMEDGKEICHTESAAETVFGITWTEASYLFNGSQQAPLQFFNQLKPSPGWDATPKQVAKHIRQFVKVKFPEQ